MPIYEYECSQRHRFELRQSFAAEPVASCPACSSAARRVIHLVPVHFKGSGFYVNDYGRNGSAAPSSKGESSGAKDSSAAKTKVKSAKGMSQEPSTSADSSTSKESSKAGGEK